MGILEVLQATLRALELVEVRGKTNRQALSVAVDNLEALVSAYKKAGEVEVKVDDDDNEQREDV